MIRTALRRVFNIEVATTLAIVICAVAWVLFGAFMSRCLDPNSPYPRPNISVCVQR
jgi:hypothetical protein